MLHSREWKKAYNTVFYTVSYWYMRKHIDILYGAIGIKRYCMYQKVPAFYGMVKANALRRHLCLRGGKLWIRSDTFSVFSYLNKILRKSFFNIAKNVCFLIFKIIWQTTKIISVDHSWDAWYGLKIPALDIFWI